jgi:hypothetical protein
LKKGIVNTIIFTIVLALFATMGASVAQASKIRDQQPQEDAYPSFDSFTPSREALSELGLNEEEIDFYLNLEDSGITIADGVLYDKDGNVIDDESELATFGVWGAARRFIHLFRNKYYQLPGWVHKILPLGKFKLVLATLEHFTGWIEDGIYNSCMSVIGWMYGSNNVCWFIAKTLTLIIA